MIARICLLSLLALLALFVEVAAAQTPSWPIVNGRHLQPTQQKVDSKQVGRAREWGRDVQSEIDRLYDQLTRESPPSRR
jgi:hypothetical protein